ncbi:MAG: hypothetical protein Q9160_008454 [Pyrenula sp. 1 TL-2023]
MSGLEIAAGVAGFISLSLGLAKRCDEAFEFLADAQELDGSMVTVRCKLDFQQHRFNQWCQRALEGPNEPDRRLNWALIRDFLVELEKLLTNTSSLREKYGLRVEEFESKQDSTTDDKSQKKGFRKFLRSSSSNNTTSTAALHSGSPTSFRRRIRWAAGEKRRVEKFLNDIASINNTLDELLDSRDRTSIRVTIDSSLREIISRSSDFHDLDIIKQLTHSNNLAQPSAIGSAASLKQLRLRLGLDKTLNEDRDGLSNALAGPDIKLKRLKNEYLSRAVQKYPPPSKEIALYRQKGAYVEWKQLLPDNKPLKQRLEALTIMLSSKEKDSSFRCLPCQGFLIDAKEELFGFVFQLPERTIFNKLASLNLSQRSSAARVVTLKDRLSSNEKLPLSSRLSISCALAETLLQLHTCGWLHKSIRSENVLFINSEEIGEDKVNVDGPYLGGYEYARQASPGEKTEEVDTSPESDLYRHPRARGPNRDRFCKTFDLYSFGCVLLELALCSPLASIVGAPPGDSDTASKAETLTEDGRNPGVTSYDSNWVGSMDQGGQVSQDIAFQVGDTWQEVIQLCLQTATTSSEGTDESSLSVQKEIVEKLQSCKY